MDRNGRGAKPPASVLLALTVLGGFAAVGCSQPQPEPNADVGGVLDSGTHQADSMRQMEERQEQNRGGGGGGGGGY
jgi:hypothetical protein